MKKARQFLGTILLIVGLLALIVGNLWLKLKYPDMTETRYFLTFWPLIAFEALTIAGGCWLMRD